MVNCDRLERLGWQIYPFDRLSKPVELKPYKPILDIPEKDYVLDGCQGREARTIKTLHLVPADALIEHNKALNEKYKRIEQELSIAEKFHTEDAELVIAAYGITARIASGAIKLAREKGLKVGLVRTVTLWPFPDEAFEEIVDTAKSILVVEMSSGQFIEDVKLATQCKLPVEFYGIGGGWYPTEEGILEKIEEVYAAQTTTAR